MELFAWVSRPHVPPVDADRTPILVDMACLGPGTGGGGTDSLSLPKFAEVTSSSPFVGHGQPLVLPSPNLQPPSFHGSSKTAPSNCHFSMNLFVYSI